MFNQFFGFNKPPFNNTPDPTFYFAGNSHKEALASMIYGVQESKGFVMITGDVGMGKTLLIQTFKNELGSNHIFIEISNPWISPEEIVGEIRHAIGIKKSENNALFDGLRDRLLEIAEQNRLVILVIDESHQMSERLIEGIRLLSNIETTTKKLIQIIFVGQNELAEIMSRSSMRQIQQRLFLSYHLEKFTDEETSKYIRHRLNISHGPTDLFSDDAIALIQSESKGIPRIINTLCDNALLFAFGRDARRVTVQDVIEAIEAKNRWLKSVLNTEQINDAHHPHDINKHTNNSHTDTDKLDIEDSQKSKSALNPAPQLQNAIYKKISDMERTRLSSPPPQPSELPHSDNYSHPIPTLPYLPQPSNHSSALPPTKHFGSVITSQFIIQLVLAVITVAVVWLALNNTMIFKDKEEQSNIPTSVAPQAPSTTPNVLSNPPTSSSAHSPAPLSPSNNEYNNSGKSQSPVTNGRAPSATTDNSSKLEIPMPAMQDYRLVNIPKEGGISSVANDTFGMWNDTTRELIYLTNPEISTFLTRLPSDAQIKIPDISRKTMIVKAANGSFHIYYGSFTTLEEAQNELQIVRRIWSGSQIQSTTRRQTPIHRIFVGPFANENEAHAALESMWFKFIPILN